MFNGFATIALGRLVERFTSWSHLVSTFFLCAIIGSIASLFLLPNATSVGASGGILGLLGFIVGLCWRRRDLLPRALLIEFIQSVVWIAAIGLLGFWLIDNAAHAGGFMMGLALAYVTMRKDAPFPIEETPLSGFLGVMSAFLLIATGVLAVAAIFGAPGL